MSLPNTSASDAAEVPLSIPDVNGLSVLDAALAYAAAGWYVLPMVSGSKNPGSVVGKGWPEKSSRDPAQIEAWWADKPGQQPHSIALHVGRSGAVVFDLDYPDRLADDVAADKLQAKRIAKALRQGAVQRSRPTTPDGQLHRGHYVFLADQPYGNSPGGFRRYGEVRGHNGVIVVQPSLHSGGGRYQWASNGPLPELHDALAACLKAATESVPAIDSDALEEFLDKHVGNARPTDLDAVLAKFVSDAADGSRYEAMRDALPWAYREARQGRYPARTATERLRAAYLDAFSEAEANGSELNGGKRRETPEREFQRLAEWAAGQAEAVPQAAIDKRAEIWKVDPVVADAFAPGGAWHRGKPPASRAGARFQLISAAQLAEPVPPMEWLIRGVWPRRSFGPMGGEKKTLKTYNLMSIALAVASGRPLFGEFEVVTPGPVVYFVGEGGRAPFQRRLHAIARAYGVDLADLPIHATFDVGPLDSPEFVAALTAALDALRPELVIIDPLYAFHPAGIEAQNLYERGRMLAEVSGIVADKAALIIADHFKKSGGSELDLDSIAQAGMGQWADSWILQKHRERADLDGGEYSLAVEFGSRQWGGSRWDVDWKLPAFGELDAGEAEHATVEWSVRRSDSIQGAGDRDEAQTLAGQRNLIIDWIRSNPTMAKTEACAALGRRHHIGDKKFRTAWDLLANDRVIVQCDENLPYGDGSRKRSKKIWRVAESGFVGDLEGG